MKLGRWIGIVFLVQISSLFAQDDNIVIDLFQKLGDEIPKSLLKEITVDMKDVRLEDALALITEKGNIQLNFDPDVVPLNKRVSISMENAYVVEVLLATLAKTNTSLMVTNGGNLLIVPQNRQLLKGSIAGVVKDATTGDPLPGANIYLVGTAIGVASDLKGEYQILAIPPGRYTLRATFIGYRQKDIEIQIRAGEKPSVNIQMDYDVVKGETVTITAQAEGQAAAINQQLRSNTITNVVSAERIMEFPDANAAESVGRLPGISIKRSGGEGNKIVIRGLSPTYNTILIGGEHIPATDLDDRSVDLNMISPEILAGIEVMKALTPDKDADTFGGTVDFKLASAPEGGFQSNFRLQNGYNAQRNEFGQYKGSMTVSNRFMNEKFGIMVTGNIERAQRGSDQFEATYTIPREKREGEEFAPIQVNHVSLNYISEVRKRLGFSLLMDYKLYSGKLMFNNFISRLDRNEIINTNRYRQSDNFHMREFRDRQRKIDVLSNSLSGEHSVLFVDVDWRVSRTTSLTRHPFDSEIDLQERSAFDVASLPEYFGPDQLIAVAYNNLDLTALYYGNFYTEKSLERDLSAQFNVRIPYTLTRWVAGFIKFGGKFRDKVKERDRGYRCYRLDSTNPGFERHHSRINDPDFIYQRIPGNQWPSINNYIDPYFDAGNFLDGRYDFGIGLDGDELDYLLNTWMLDSLYATSSYSDLDDYETVEQVSAGYIMTEINFGRLFMLLPGVRYEHTHNDMTGRKGWVPSDDTEPELDQPYVTDTTAVSSYGRFFPMLHARLRPLNWLDVRLAFTKTLSRPRLDMMLPRKKVYASQRVSFGNPELKPQVSNNYDVFLSFYSNSIGLLTLGGFYKKIDDLIFNREGHKILNAAKEGFTPDLQGLVLDRPENNKNKTEIKGFEVEWQTNFRWLPRPFDGLVLNVNYTHIWSETQFPRSFVVQERIPVFPFVKSTMIDTFRVGAMPDQADDIANVSLGYDRGPFSARISMLYQGRTLTNIGERPELDGFTADLLRWDLSIKLSVTRNLSLFFNFNNVTNEPDESFQQVTSYPTQSEYYGWTSDFGVGYTIE